mgnify:FL=1
MNEPLWLGIAWVVIMIINLVASAAKSSFTHVRLPWLLNLGVENQTKVDKTISLIEKQGTRTALRLGLVVSHFLLAGLTVLLLDRATTIESAWLVLLILLAVLVLVSTLEFIIERRILVSPEQSALKWTGAAGIISFFVSPLTRMMMSLLGEHAEKVTL